MPVLCHLWSLIRNCAQNTIFRMHCRICSYTFHTGWTDCFFFKSISIRFLIFIHLSGSQPGGVGLQHAPTRCLETKPTQNQQAEISCTEVSNLSGKFCGMCKSNKVIDSFHSSYWGKGNQRMNLRSLRASTWCCNGQRAPLISISYLIKCRSTKNLRRSWYFNPLPFGSSYSGQTNAYTLCCNARC